MKTEEAINLINSGKLVNCSHADYSNHIRSGIQEQAGKWIDQGQHVKAIIAINEVKSLDIKFGL